MCFVSTIKCYPITIAVEAKLKAKKNTSEKKVVDSLMDLKLLDTKPTFQLKKKMSISPQVYISSKCG